MIARFLEETDTFSFGCQMTGDCCREYTILCTPYDVVRLRSATGETTSAMMARRLYEITQVSFSAAFTDDSITAVLALFGATPRDQFPIARLVKTTDEAGPTCPNLRDRLCSVYEHRPGVCRSYPLGRVRTADGPRWFEREYGCPGKGRGTQTVGDWIAESGLSEYTEGNDRFAAFAADALAAGLDYERLSADTQHALVGILYDFDRALDVAGCDERETLRRIDTAARGWLSRAL